MITTEVKCKNLTGDFCNSNVHDIMVKMGAKKSRIFERGLFEKDEYIEHLFCWDDVPKKEEQCNKLKTFIRERYNLDWVDEAEIKKIEKDNAIRISTDPEKLTEKLIIRKNKDKATVNYFSNIGELKAEKLILRYNDVCYPKYSKLEGEDCIQYLQEYVPLHLPQIAYVLSDILTRVEFINNRTINIMDICSGPATVPLAFCRIKEDKIRDRIFKITTVEGSQTFNKMIQDFKNTNNNMCIDIINTIQRDIIDFMMESTFKMGYEWIVIANSITAMGEDRSFANVNVLLDKFIFNVLNSNEKLGYSNRILLTIIEGGNENNFNFKFIDYLNKIENLGFANLKIIDVIQPELPNKKNTRIPAEWILKCDFYKRYYSLSEPNVNSKSFLLELKNE